MSGKDYERDEGVENSQAMSGMGQKRRGEKTRERV